MILVRSAWRTAPGCCPLGAGLLDFLARRTIVGYGNRPVPDGAPAKGRPMRHLAVIVCFACSCLSARGQSTSPPAAPEPKEPPSTVELAPESRPGFAGDQTSSGWRFLVAPYVWVPSVHGDL